MYFWLPRWRQYEDDIVQTYRRRVSRQMAKGGEQKVWKICMEKKKHTPTAGEDLSFIPKHAKLDNFSRLLGILMKNSAML